MIANCTARLLATVLIAVGLTLPVEADDLLPVQEVASIKAHAHLVGLIEFSPDGKRIYTRGDDRVLRVWDAQTGKGLDEIRAGLAGIPALFAVTPDGKRLVTAMSEKGTSKPLIVNSGSGSGSVKGSGLSVQYPFQLVDLSGKAKPVILDDSFKGWQVASENRLTFTKDGSSLACYDRSLGVAIWDLKAASKTTPDLVGAGYSDNTGFVSRCVMSPDGKSLAFQFRDKNGLVDDYVLWDIQGGKKALSFATKLSVRSYDVLFHPDGKSLVVVDQKGVSSYDTSTGKLVRRFHTSKPFDERKVLYGIARISFDTSGKKMLAFLRSNDPKAPPVAMLWDSETGALLAKIETEADAITATLSPNGTMVAVGRSDGLDKVVETDRIPASSFAGLVNLWRIGKSGN